MPAEPEATWPAAKRLEVAAIAVIRRAGARDVDLPGIAPNAWY